MGTSLGCQRDRKEAKWKKVQQVRQGVIEGDLQRWGGEERGAEGLA